MALLAGLKAGRFRVVEEPGSGSIFGALAKAGADARSLETLASAAPGPCFARGTYLAYWGNPRALCWR